ncbi:unnamed protein product [Pleuronectes platessa]|uniref:Uncharacterized protein n=1 Tax=Pleuronectes platessa TaxID=8262 RepID=A0A9N7VGE1_PLEPL|nr:unnamed protein product [Pleuronectes platessa]
MRHSHQRVRDYAGTASEGTAPCGSRLKPVFRPRRKQGSKGFSVRSQTKSQTGGVGICVRFETTGEKVRGAGREISEMQTDGRLWPRLEMGRLGDEMDSRPSVSQLSLTVSLAATTTTTNRCTLPCPALPCPGSLSTGGCLSC